MLPVGFGVLLLQGIAEIIKCVAGADHQLRTANSPTRNPLQ